MIVFKISRYVDDRFLDGENRIVIRYLPYDFGTWMIGTWMIVWLQINADVDDTRSSTYRTTIIHVPLKNRYVDGCSTWMIGGHDFNLWTTMQ